MNDPHGDLIDDSAHFVPKDRVRDVLLLNPQAKKYPGLGIFDFTDKDMGLRYVMTLFEAHAGDGWGKRSASILRNLTRAMFELYTHPTIVHLYMLIADDEYADKMLAKCKNPLTKHFHKFWWQPQMTKMRLEAFAAPLNKIEELMEPGIVEFFAQTKSLNFRKLLDDQKIVFCRFPKSYLGKRGTQILFAFVMMKLLTEAMRRKRRGRAVYVVCDEFQNQIVGMDVDMALAELRKYGIHLIVTNQTRRQLGEDADIVAGNVSHIVAFRMAAVDAEVIVQNFGKSKDSFASLVNLPNFQFAALSTFENEPMVAERVYLLSEPEKWGDEAPARKVMAWAAENTGVAKELITKQIMEQLA